MTNLSIIIMFMGVGIGAAAPIGPVNIEIIRRHIHFGSVTAIIFGSAACLADFTYFILLLTGFLVIIDSSNMLNALGLIGSFIICLYGFITICSKNKLNDHYIEKSGLVKTFFSGYLMTMLNPYNILFWLSVSTQIATLQNEANNVMMLAGTGVLIGTMSWVIALNLFIHFSKTFISKSKMNAINIMSGCVLIIFGVIGLCRAVANIHIL